MASEFVERLRACGFAAAVKAAKDSLAEGGIPIGAVFTIDNRVYVAHNRRVQDNDPIAHAEMVAIRMAGRLTAAEYARSTLYTTLSPCWMCSGAIFLYKIPLVIIGENVNFIGPEAFLKSRGVQIMNMNDEECVKMMKEFIEKNPKLWDEDLGVGVVEEKKKSG